MLRKRILSVILAGIVTMSTVFAGISTQDTAAADTWRSSLYPENWTPGYTNSAGQFLHDFSYAGYEKGEKAVPESMSGLWADVTAYGADKTGATDSTAAIQSAINAVEAAGGGTVYLPAGIYKVKPASNEYASALRIKGSNILFKGDGEGKTFLRCFAENMRYCQVINISPDGGTWDTADDGNYYYLSQDITNTPTTTIHLNSVGNLKAGDWVIIRSDRTQSWIDEHSMGGFWYASVNPTTMGTTFYRQITAVNASNNTIEIDIPTRYYMKTRDNARVYKVTPKQSNVGLCDFSIGNKANSTTYGWGEEDYKTSGNGGYSVNNAFLIKFGYNVNCFAKNISTYDAGNANGYHMSSNGLDISKTRSLTVDNCDFSHPQYEGGGGNGYGMNICGQETLIKDCSSTSTRHSYSFKYSYANGNVVYHYTSTDPKYGSDFHMYLSMSNLIDNQELNGDFIESNVRPYGGTAGNRHGYTSTQTVFWNTKGNYYKSGNNYIIDSRQYGYGYVIGTQGAATAVKTTPTTMSSTYGTVDTAPEDYTEGIGAGSTLYPQSLYYDQLNRRLNGGQTDTPTETPTQAPSKGVLLADGTYAITAIANNMVVCADNYGDDPLIANREAHGGAWEEFELVNNSDGTVSLKSVYNGKYVCAVIDESNQLLARSAAISTWEKFELEQVTTGQYALKAVANSMYVKADLNNNAVLYAASSAVGGAWECFTFAPISTGGNTGGGGETEESGGDTSGSIMDGITTSGGIDDFKIVGYVPNWYGTGYLNNIDYSQVTHLIYAFAIPTTSGTILSLNDNGFMEALVNKAHANGVKVSIAIGGWSYNGVPLEDTFAQATNTDAKCKTLADAMLAVVDQYGLDGIDVDWEYPRSNTSWQFETLIKYLREGLDARGGGKVLTAAVAGTNTVGYSSTALSMMDWVNIMAYDGDSGSGHSPYSYAVNSTQAWKNVGLPNEKLVVGVPFYERPNWASYATIVAADAANAYKDSTVINGTTVYYNGLDTIAAKTKYACENAGGIMIWEMSQDTTNRDLSLLNKIYTTAVANLGTGSAPVMTEVSMSQTAVLTPNLAYTSTGSMAPATSGASGDYFINVKDAGTYTLTFSVKGAGGGAGYTNALSVYTGEPGTRNVSSTAAATVTIPGLWTTDAVKIAVPITLQTGEQVIRIASGAAGFTLVQAELAKPAETDINLAVGESRVVEADAFAASAENYVIIDGGLEYTVAGNAFDYKVNVANLGTYKVKVNYGLESAANVAFQFDMVAEDVTTALGTVAAPATGAWGTYGDTEGLELTLPAGSYVLRMTITGDGSNVKNFTVTREEDPEPSTEETSTEAPSVEEPSTEEASTEAPSVEEPSTEESSSEESSETIIKPSKVTGVQAVYENGKIRLTWDDNGAAQYRVMRFDGITPGYTTLTYRATADGYMDGDLIDVHRYYYRICGYFYDAEGKLVQGSVSDAAGIVATDREPSKVENLTATVKDGVVTLSWDKADGVRYYKIARAKGSSTAEGSYSCLQYNVEETTYTDTKSAPGKWRYKVVGYYKAVDSSWVYGEMSTTLFLTVE